MRPACPRVWFALALASALAVDATAAGNAATTTLKLGVDLPLSGIDGGAAIPARNGVLLAIDDANARGFPGGATVELDDLDDSVQGKHDPAQGAQNLRAFANDGSVFSVVGPMNSNVAKAEIPISNAAGLAQISMATTSVELTKGPEAVRLRSAAPDRPAFFRVCASDDRQGAAIAAFALGRGLRRAFVVDDNESYGKGLADVFAPAFVKSGGTLLGREHLTPFAIDYKPMLTKIAAERPDVVFFGGIVSTGGGILRRQMADVGLGGVAYVGGDGLAGPDYVPLAGNAADDTYFTVISPNIERLPAARGFIAAYRKRFGVAPGVYSAGAYAAATVALTALRRVWTRHPASTPGREEVLRAIAASHGVATPLGSLTFDANGDVLHPTISIYRIVHGKSEFISQSVTR